MSVGDGNIISGLHKGFKDLVSLGWLETCPRIFGVQAEGSAAIANAFFIWERENIIPVQRRPLLIASPLICHVMESEQYRAARETGGSYILVSDDEIISAIAELGKVGIFAEPAGATSYAGLVKAVTNWDDKI